MKNYLVATNKRWNIEAFHQYTRNLPGNWKLLTDQQKLTAEIIDDLQPRYIFFPHWSSLVPNEILSKAECVCFHMTDVPYGRGGSPLQNLISRGHKETKLTALRMEGELDTGPVYKKENLILTGSAQEIYERAARKIYELIDHIVRNEPEPVPQEGKVTTFKRRKPDMSQLPLEGTMEQMYDHIRMLDAETYPHAFLVHGDYRLEFSEAEQLTNEEVKASVIIKKKEND